MEVCVDSLESVVAAHQGGADRIELCASLGEGGLTPSYGLLRSVQKYLAQHDPERRFQVNCMIRCRAGDFLYSDLEMDSMIEDVNKFIELQVDGLVFGALTPEGVLDQAVCRQFLDAVGAAGKVKTTFHRAFDVCSDWQTCFEQIQSLGFDKLLTSGLEKTAFEGRRLIAELVRLSEERRQASQHAVGIIAGAGVSAQNLESILVETSCPEFHASCRVSSPSKMVFKNANISMGSAPNPLDDYFVKNSSKERVSELAAIYRRLRPSTSK